MEQQHGLLVVNKPCGISSAQCTGRLKRLGQKKIGHAGTLDPMASGVLLVLLGCATKISGYLLSGGKKVYKGTLRLGQTTDTWDAEGKILSEAPWQNISEATVHAEVEHWKSQTTQEVPPYSAAKHEGRPLYRLARAGKECPVKTKTIEITQAEVLDMALPLVTFRVTCSSGVYIRSLAHSLGTRLECGAMLTELTREYSHPFGLDQAVSLQALLDEPELLPKSLVSIAAALPQWATITVSQEEVADVRNGMPIQRKISVEKALLFEPNGNALALVEASEQQNAPVWTVLRGLWV